MSQGPADLALVENMTTLLTGACGPQKCDLRGGMVHVLGIWLKRMTAMTFAAGLSTEEVGAILRVAAANAYGIMAPSGPEACPRMTLE